MCYHNNSLSLISSTACSVLSCATCTTSADTCATCIPGRQLSSTTCTSEYRSSTIIDVPNAFHYYLNDFHDNFFSAAECLDGCGDCSSSTSTPIDADTINLDVSCDTCEGGKALIHTNLCYGMLAVLLSQYLCRVLFLTSIWMWPMNILQIWKPPCC